jgi:CubicO group peptidase (beta-lactamase class C family)
MSQPSIIHNDITDPDFRQLGDQVIEAMQRLHVPGVAVGILHQEQDHYAGFGVTSVEHPLPVNADTLFQIGSITKTFVGTAAMRLVELGQLDLDAPIRTYLPDLRLASEETASKVTLRHLFTHTGGWVGDYFNDFGYGDDALARMVSQVGALEKLTPLGALFSYNNAGFYLAGRVIEMVTGKPFEAALKELVLDPLGLAMSFFFPHDVITHRFVVGHETVDGEPRVARPWAVGRAIHPAGGIVSNVKDLVLYARFHMGNGTSLKGTRLLTPESLAAMKTPQVPGSGMTDAVGITWMLTNAGGAWVVRHGGGTKGQVTEFRLAPAHRFAIAVLTNSEDGGELCDQIANWAMRHYLGLGMPEAAPLDLPADRLARYVGRYASSGSNYELSLREGGLTMQVIDTGGFPTPETPPPPTQPPPVRLAFYGEDRIVALDSPFKDDRGEFLVNPDGSIEWFRFGGRIRKRQE